MPELPAIHLPLLHLLLQVPDYRSCHALARTLDIPVTVLPRHVETLRSAGCVIESHPQLGVRLLRAGLACYTDYLQPRHADRLGRRVLIYQQTTSTQDVARQLVDGSADPGRINHSVIIADHQSAGRGRLGRQWFAPPGSSLLLTVIAQHPSFTIDRLMLATAHALARCLLTFAPLELAFRWPNDLLLHDAKLAGILVEVVAGSALIGIGINVDLDPAALPSPLDQPVTSLAPHGLHLDRLVLADALLDHLHQALYHDADSVLLESWRSRSALLQKRHTFESAGKRLTGRVLDLDPFHGLVLQLDSGPIVTLPAATTSLILDPNV